jgi:hypothetical protein
MRRVEEEREELVAHACEMMGDLVFAECKKHIDGTKATEVLLPAIAFLPECKRMNGRMDSCSAVGFIN